MLEIFKNTFSKCYAYNTLFVNQNNVSVKC